MADLLPELTLNDWKEKAEELAMAFFQTDVQRLGLLREKRFLQAENERLRKLVIQHHAVGIAPVEWGERCQICEKSEISL